jgi:hypothetical protein
MPNTAGHLLRCSKHLALLVEVEHYINGNKRRLDAPVRDCPVCRAEAAAKIATELRRAQRKFNQHKISAEWFADWARFK